MTLALLQTLEDLDAAMTGSATRPLLLFKHSLTCGSSAWAHEELEDFLAAAPVAVDARVVHVQTGRAVSQAIAERFGIRHESPQIFLVVAGQVVWHASHHRIRGREIAAAVSRAVATGPDRS